MVFDDGGLLRGGPLYLSLNMPCTNFMQYLLFRLQKKHFYTGNTHHILNFCYTVILVGFPYEEMTFPASAIGNATLKVFGQAQQGFTVNYTQEG